MKTLYTKTDEYIKVDGDTAIIGISDYAQEQLGDLIFIEEIPAGKKLDKGGILTAIESVKAATDVYSPITAEVIEFNEALSSEPGIVNRSAEDEGWVVKVKILDPSELDDLLSPEDYANSHD
ncbi:MAG: glycine cleavage system protein GcvH [Caldisericia bacterium]